MKLIIVFTKIESHSDFNGEGTIEVSKLMKDVDEDFNSIGFDEYSHHFHRLLPLVPIKGNTFHTNEANIKALKPDHSEILLIQLTENLENWSKEFIAEFIAYASNFDQVYISYHKGLNNGDDIRNGNHRLLEEYLKDKEIFTTEKYQHIDDDSQLYAVLARAIVENKGSFSKKSYDELIKRLIAFFPSLEDITKENHRNVIQKVIKDISSIQNYKATNAEIEIVNTYLEKAGQNYAQLYLDDKKLLLKHLNGILINL